MTCCNKYYHFLFFLKSLLKKTVLWSKLLYDRHHCMFLFFCSETGWPRKSCWFKEVVHLKWDFSGWASCCSKPVWLFGFCTYNSSQRGPKDLWTFIVWHFSKYHILCSTEQSSSYRLGTTQGWVSYYISFLAELSLPLLVKKPGHNSITYCGPQVKTYAGGQPCWSFQKGY